MPRSRSSKRCMRWCGGCRRAYGTSLCIAQEALLWLQHPARAQQLRSGALAAGGCAMAETSTPTQTRQQHSEFVARCRFTALRPHLPLLWPAPPDLPPSPKRRYRSQYAYLGAEDLDSPGVWDDRSDFELLLRLVDFSPLRPVLAQLLGWTSAQGWTPFGPVSLFLLCGWQLTQQWNRATTLQNLAKSDYAAVRRRLGFQEGIYPTEGGLRYFLTVVWEQVTVCPDGMLHLAAARMRRTTVAETCYRDPEARYVWYSGSNGALGRRCIPQSGPACLHCASKFPATPPPRHFTLRRFGVRAGLRATYRLRLTSPRALPRTALTPLVPRYALTGLPCYECPTNVTS